MTPAFIKRDSATKKLLCQHAWTLANITDITKEFAALSKGMTGEIVLDGNDITQMDSAGAWLISTWMKPSAGQTYTLQLQHFSEPHQRLLTLVEKQNASESRIPPAKSLPWLARVGKSVVVHWVELKEFLAFIGKLSEEMLRLLRHPKRFRWPALVNVIEQTGYHALPIIALLSFMIGVVIAYQMGVQLRSYGANIFIVDFLGLSILREFGPLLTAIMLAGRSGSAFTAQLGIMKVNQEIDALDTMGVTPAELLILPRIFGLVIALPLLTMWANIFGILGGMMMAKSMLSVNAHDFLTRFGHQIPLKTLLLGLCKTPIFALLIASIGCFSGMKVEGSADSLGKQTTRSVVLAIFFIILADAVFSIIFSWVRL
jgi:phospholipid/cholesterol/gamma-HCH transport system permease protein